MLGTPLVIFYRVSTFEARVGPQLLVPRHIGQVNLLSARELTSELYLQQHDPDALAAAVEPSRWRNPSRRSTCSSVR